jgi:protein-disulfide isomerase
VVKLVFRQFPLPMHDRATQAAEASVCVGQQQDLFWAAHDFFFQHQRELSRSNVREAFETELKSNPNFNLERFRQHLM